MAEGEWTFWGLVAAFTAKAKIAVLLSRKWLRSCSAQLGLRRAAWRAHSRMWRAAWCQRRWRS